MVIPTKLYVTNFPFTFTQLQIHDLFTRYSQVVECTLKKDYCAYVLCTNAFKIADGLRMLGRKLTVHLATSKKSLSHLNHPNMLNTTTTQQQQTNINDTNTNASEPATTGLSSSSSPPLPTLPTNSNDSSTNIARLVRVCTF